MKLEDYKKLTIIMRDYTEEQADLITRVASDFGKQIVIEMTLNTNHAYEQIKNLNKKYSNKILIGAGTVRNYEQLVKAHKNGAKFVLGPHTFTQVMLDYCKEKEIISVPSAMTPSEVNLMFQMGADIVKVFPATVVTPKYFRDIQGPFGKIPLMAVGGVSIENVKEFFDNGAEYVGIGSNLFSKEDLDNLNEEKIRESIKNILNLINE